MIIGSMLLFTSFIGFNIKVSQNRGESEFYNAETALDEIRAHLQIAVSDCVEDAYRDVFTKGLGGNEDVQAAFMAYFRTRLSEWRHGTELLFDGADAGVINSYSYDVLRDFISADEDDLELIVPANSIDRIFDVGGRQITLMDIKVEHTARRDGFYISRASTDITISIPDFSYASSNVASNALSTHVLISQNITRNDSFDVTISGNAYAGTAEFGSSGRLSFRNGTFVSGNKIFVRGREGNEGNLSNNADNSAHARFYAANTAVIWANRIEVRDGGLLYLNRGSTFVYDDLELATPGTRAYLAGRYVGFGGQRGFGAGREPEKSSAILVNGMNSQLDMSKLTHLSLAGLSFISDHTPAVTGQSFTVKSDQFAYLVPEKLIVGGKNPAESADAELVPNGANIPLWTGQSQTLSDYADGIVRVFVTMEGAQFCYAYIEFRSREHANQYFRDYFAVSGNIKTLEEHFNRYMDFFRGFEGDLAELRVAGVTYGGTETALRLIDSNINGIQGINEQSYVNEYESRRRTLLRNGGCPVWGDEYIQCEIDCGSDCNPYNYYVNTDAVSAVSPSHKYFFGPDGDTSDNNTAVAMVVNGNLNLGTDVPPNVRLIICSGNVNIQKDFNGLVLSGGNIALATAGITVSSHSTGVLDAMRATNGEDSMGNYFTDKVDISAASTGDGTMAWDLSRIVRYDNWRKNW
jgi:hypothetical protein